MDLIESQASLNEEVLESEPSPSLLPSNEQFESVQQLPNTEVVQHLPNHEPSTSLNSVEIHPADFNVSNRPVSAYSVSPHEIISLIKIQSLSKYVTVTGNQHRNLFFWLFGLKTQSLFKNILDFQAIHCKCLKKHAF
ncbi:hypothetical protein TNCV_275931 [Trichonephila clavipes]|nr:hypothetical protein TNCV_4570281 [Trichonephila clavipes]GFV20781.1 hypothetical protein TNCV_2815301 [Trichonephila clavipes]GFW11061.1 hypothetical protein TNCV_275931 [Trichonephila clavipes]